MLAGTLDTVTRSLRVPLYYGCNLKCFVTILFAPAFAACSSVGSRTSHVAKILRQKYWHGMPAFLNSSSKVSLFSPTSLFVFRSEMTSERILGVNFSTISGMGSISFKVLCVLAHPVSFKVVRSSLLALPRFGTLLSRLYRAVLVVNGFLCLSGDWKRRPICPYKAFLCCRFFFCG